MNQEFNLSFKSDLDLLKKQAMDTSAALDELAANANDANKKLSDTGKDSGGLDEYKKKISTVEQAEKELEAVRAKTQKTLANIDKQVKEGLLLASQRGSLTKQAYQQEIKDLEGVRAKLDSNVEGMEKYVDALNASSAAAIQNAKSSGAGMSEFEQKIDMARGRMENLVQSMGRMGNVVGDIKNATAGLKGMEAVAKGTGIAMNSMLGVVGAVLAAISTMKQFVDMAVKAYTSLTAQSKLHAEQQEKINLSTRTMAGDYEAIAKLQERSALLEQLKSDKALNASVSMRAQKALEDKILAGEIQIYDEMGYWIISQKEYNKLVEDEKITIMQAEAAVAAQVKGVEQLATIQKDQKDALAKVDVLYSNMELTTENREAKEREINKINRDSAQAQVEQLTTIIAQLKARGEYAGTYEMQLKDQLAVLHNTKEEEKGVDKVKEAFDAAEAAKKKAIETTNAEKEKGFITEEQAKKQIADANEAEFKAMVNITSQFTAQEIKASSVGDKIQPTLDATAKIARNAQITAASMEEQKKTQAGLSALTKQQAKDAAATGEAQARASLAVESSYTNYDNLQKASDKLFASMHDGYMLERKDIIDNAQAKTDEINKNKDLNAKAKAAAIELITKERDAELNAAGEAYLQKKANAAAEVKQKTADVAASIAQEKKAAAEKMKFDDADFQNFQAYQAKKDAMNAANKEARTAEIDAVKKDMEARIEAAKAIEGISNEEKALIIGNIVEESQVRIDEINKQAEIIDDMPYAEHWMKEGEEIAKSSEKMINTIVKGSTTGFKTMEGAMGSSISAMAALTDKFGNDMVDKMFPEGKANEKAKAMVAAIVNTLNAIGDAFTAFANAGAESLEERMAGLQVQFEEERAIAKRFHEDTLSQYEEEFNRAMEQMGFAAATSKEGQEEALQAAIDSGDAKAIYEEEQRQKELALKQAYDEKVKAENERADKEEKQAAADLENAKLKMKYDADMDKWKSDLISCAISQGMAITQAIVASMGAAAMSGLAAPAVFSAYNILLVGLAVAGAVAQIAAITAQKPKEPKKVMPKFAKGGVFDSGQIVTEETLFDVGMMGESGPEAIMPLTQGDDGALGVNASGMSGGGAGDIIINLMVDGAMMATSVVAAMNDGKTQVVNERMVSKM